MSVTLEDSIFIHIENDKELVVKFLKFTLDNEIFSYRGGGSGLGNLTQWYPMQYKLAIYNFFKEEGKL